MRAYSFTRYGAPEVLEQVEVAKPSPRPDEILIKVHTTTVSAADWRIRSMTMPKGMGLIGRLMFGIRGPRKPILGTEFSGVVEAIGHAAQGFDVGDAVIGYPGGAFGAHAQFVTMPANGSIVRKPANIGIDAAAALPFGATTAYDFLINKGKLRREETVLINGASGSVGTACVQIAKHIGAQVTAICSARNEDLVRDLGAQHVIDYNKGPIIQSGQRYDMVVDTVGTMPWSEARNALRRRGRMVLIAGKTGDMIFGPLAARLAGKRMIAGVASEDRAVLQAVVDLAASGVLRPVIDRVYPFDEMRAAHRYVDTGRKRGNVLVSIMNQDAAA